MAGSVGDEGDEPVMRRALGVQRVQQSADGADKVDIPPLIVAADVVAAAHCALLADQQQGLGVIFYIKPVAHVQTLPVDGDGPPGQSVQDHHRDELFGKMVRPVIVRAIRQNDGQAIGLVPCADEMVRRGL